MTRPARLPADAAAPPTSLWDARVRGTTIGSLVLVLLAAFEAMAVTTVMPLVVTDLDGEALYAVAFAATLAASVIAMVAAGRWSDRSGPVPSLLVGVGVFLVGLVVAGTATVMPVFVLGRFLQGLGGGAITVTLYVVVARIYPALLHPRMFGLFAAAWVLPSMVGPLLAGVLAEHTSWHWVFLGVALLVPFAVALLWPSVRVLWAATRGDGGARAEVAAVEADTVASPEDAAPADVAVVAVPDAVDADAADAVGTRDTGGRVSTSTSTPRAVVSTPVALALASVVAFGLIATGTVAEVLSGPLAWLAMTAAFVVVVLAVRPLLPTGTLLAHRGLPATIAMRGTLAAAYFGTEVYLPLMLQREHGLSVSRAGLVLTVGALSWSTGSAIQARLGDRVPSSRFLVLGATGATAGVVVQIVTVLADLGPWAAMAGWLLGGLGMGLAFPRISTLVLAYSAPGEQGANSSALTISDAVGASAVTAVTGVLFATLGGTDAGPPAYAAAFALCLVIGVLTVLVARRAGAGSPAAAPSGTLAA